MSQYVRPNPETPRPSTNPLPTGSAAGHSSTKLLQPRGDVSIGSKLHTMLNTRLGRERADAALAKQIDDALARNPSSFLGEGRRFVAKHSVPNSLKASLTKAKRTVMTVTAIPYADVWTHHPDSEARDPHKLDTSQQFQQQTGTNTGTSRGTNLQVKLNTGALPSTTRVVVEVGANAAHNQKHVVGTHDQRSYQRETRTTGGSEFFRQDVYYRVEFHREGVESFGTGVKNGMTTRVSKGSAVPKATELRVPKHFTPQPDAHLGSPSTEGFGPVKSLFEWAVQRIDAKPGTREHQQLSDYFSTEHFHGMADELARGPLPPFDVRKSNGTSAGRFEVGKAESGQHHLIEVVDDAELRITDQITVKNEVLVQDNRRYVVTFFGGSRFAIPTEHAPNLFMQLGLTLHYSHDSSEVSLQGGNVGRKITGRVKGSPTALYLQEMKVPVTIDGVSHTLDTWSLVRLPVREARERAGWDPDIHTRPEGSEPPLPASWRNGDYDLTHTRATDLVIGNRHSDDPASPHVLVDQVLDWIGRTHGDSVLVAPRPGTDRANLRGQWNKFTQYISGERSRAEQNTRIIMAKFDERNLAATLNELAHDGLSVKLFGRSLTKQRFFDLNLKVDLDPPVYHGTDRDEMTRQAINAGERVGNSHSTTHTYGAQVAATLELRSGATLPNGTPEHIGVLGAKGGANRQHTRSTGSMGTAGREDVTATPAGVHSYRATGTLRATLVGVDQWHSPYRAVTLGRANRTIHGPATVGGHGATLGDFSVMLHLSEQHAPKVDPHAEGAFNPYATDRETTSRELRPDETEDLWAPSEWQRGDSLKNIPVMTLFVPTDTHIQSAGPLVANRATRGEWTLTTPGTSQHERMKNAFSSMSLTSDADQVFSPTGKQLNDVRAPGFLYGATGDIRLVGRRGEPTAVGGPVDLKPEQNRSLDLAISGETARAGCCRST